MSVVGHKPPPFFKRGPAPLAKLVFFVAISLALLVVDLRFRTLDAARVVVATVIYPMQRFAQTPVNMLSQGSEYFTSFAQLKEENDSLHEKQLASAALLLRQEHLEMENQRLRALLDMKARQKATSHAAELVYTARDPFSRKAIIDKGDQDGIGLGQVVVDDVGVIGQVTRIYPLSSEVTLLTDKDQTIPVQVLRNGLRTVLAGVGVSGMELRYLAGNADVQAGDVLVTSGLDGVYLPGLPVARVIKIDRDSAYAFAHILCEPLAGVERNSVVLVLGNRDANTVPAHESLEPQIQQSAGKGKKMRRPKMR